MWSKKWVVLLNAANPQTQIEALLPGGNPTIHLEAWATGAAANVLVFEGGLAPAEVANRLGAGQVDAMMSVPRDAPARVATSGPGMLTIAADAAPAGNVWVTIRLLQVA